jgi:uncharacterized protein
VSIQIDVSDLLDQPGASRRLEVERPVADLRTELVRVPDGAPVGADLLLESVVAGILASGDLHGTFALTCARCLTGFEAPFDLHVQELFGADVAPEDPDGYPLGDGQVDLEPVIRDVVMLAMPYSPLCRSDCQGLCERCGGDRNLGECTCEPAVDARWAPLADLVLDDDDSDVRSRSN